MLTFGMELPSAKVPLFQHTIYLKGPLAIVPKTHYFQTCQKWKGCSSHLLMVYLSQRRETKLSKIAMGKTEKDVYTELVLVQVDFILLKIIENGITKT